jgi:type IV pilus assembly protein PilA
MVGPMSMQPPYQAQQAPPQKKGMSTCLIIAIVVGALSIPVIGVVAVLGIYGVRKYIAAAKTAEAKNGVDQIARLAVAAYERDDAELVAPGKAAPHRLCGSATPVPRDVPKGVKYMPSTAAGADFQSGSATAGWTCLKFAMGMPMYYQYGYVQGAGSGKSGATANGFEASARGDLDGNGATSLFARGADVRNGNVVLSTQIYIENEFE